MSIDIKQLAHAVVLADKLNFSDAASEVNLSQSAFSRSIQSLEADLRMSLFDRGSKSVALSPVGQAVIEEARDLMQRVREFERRCELIRQAEGGNLKIGAGTVWAAMRMADLVERFGASYPAVSLDVVVGDWDQLLRDLLSEKLEFFIALIHLLPNDKRLEVEPLGQFDVAFYCRRDHPMLPRTVVTAEDLDRYGALTTIIRQDQLELIAQALGYPKGTQMRIPLRSNDVRLLRDTVLRTDHLLLFVKDEWRREVAAGDMVQLHDGRMDNLNGQFGIVRLQHRSLSPAAARLIELVRSLYPAS